MKVKTISVSLFVFTLLFVSNLRMNAENRLLELWYQQPADEWMKSLPIGNGRLGAMIFGGVNEETIALNESTMWSGEYDENQQKPFGKERLTALRQLFFDGKLGEGNQKAREGLQGNFSSFGTHLPIGDLKLRFFYPEGEVTNYRHSLNLETATSEVTYRVGNVTYTREAFATNPDDVLVIRINSDKKQMIHTKLSLKLLREADIYTENGLLSFEGKVSFPKQGRGGVAFVGRISITTNGRMDKQDNSLVIQDADEVIIRVDVRTNYKNEAYRELCRQTIEKAKAQSFKTLKKRHIKDYAPYFQRVALTLGDNRFADLPTDQRWQQRKEGVDDPGLDALFFQYGRYLLIASSRENSPLPVALQGFFNDNLACHMGWTNDYHLDINTQQNYWISNIGNLPECNLPLFRYIEDLSVHGAKTAEVVYGCKGWTAHTLANPWGCTAPSTNIGWGLFPTASSWIASHLWTQYEYTLDKKYLGEVAYPLLKGNAAFLLDYMTVDPKTGYLVTGPSISPENNFIYQGEYLCASMMPTCDRVLAHEIFQACIQACTLLGIDTSFRDSLVTALAKLPPIRLRVNGAVCEWYEDYEEGSPNHRHTTHLLALYPYAQISLEKTPELAAGARKTISDRLSAPGWEDVEWSRASMICFYARLKDPVEAYKSITILENSFLRENLLSISPAGIAGAPYDIFIFDGNAAGAAGIGEMLIQHHEGYIEFLPCLPEQWNNGSYRGLCVKGGAEVAASWQDGKVLTATVKAAIDNEFRIKIPEGKEDNIRLNGKRFDRKDQSEKGFVTVKMKKGDWVEFK